MMLTAAPNALPEPPVGRRPIRVLVVTARFLPELGGTETHVQEVTSRLSQRGDLDLTVLTTDRSGRLPRKEQFEGFTVMRCRSYPRHRDYYLAPSLYRLVLAGHYDLIHCQGIHTAVPIITMMAARRHRIPYVVTFHTGGHSSERRNRFRRLQWHALGPLLRGAAVLVAVSRFEQLMFQKACQIAPSCFRIIPNGGDISPGTAPTQPIPGRIVSCGRLERYKGHQRAIAALPVVQRSIPDATLHILGSGPYEGELRSLIDALGLATSVTIDCIPSHDRDRMARALREASVFAAFSEYEANPVAVMEALAQGSSVVGIDTAGIGDLVQDGLVEGVPKDASSEIIGQTLIAALDHRRIPRSAALPTWDRAAADLACVYMEAVGAVPQLLRLYER
jgi:glycosyltransferase involved in cell wall biosynthesis